MDYTIFSKINGWTGRWPWFDQAWTFIGGDYFLYVFVLSVVVLGFNKKLRNHAYIGLVSALVSYSIIAQALKHWIYRPRPFEILPLNQLLIDNDRGNSFPSGHATVYFALAFAFWGTKYFWPFLILAIIGSLGRVVVGVHYPLDILAGAIIGSAASLLLRHLHIKITASRQ